MRTVFKMDQSVNKMISLTIVFYILTNFIITDVRAGFHLPSFDISNLWNIFRPKQIRIVNGRTAFDEEFPYQVLVKGFKREEGYICGGSIISDHHILTAAHCVSEMDYIRVMVGSRVIKYQPGYPVFLITPRDVMVHEGYDNLFMKNDIAIIKLKYSLSFQSGYVQPIRLPRLSQRNPENFDNDIASLAGWGKIHDRDKQAHTTLQATKLSIMPFWQCRYYLSTMYYQLDNTQICTLYFGSGPCSGDSGGGLTIIEQDGIKTVIGIVSFGLSFCESGNPTIYTSISGYLPWIHQYTGIMIRK